MSKFYTKANINFWNHASSEIALLTFQRSLPCLGRRMVRLSTKTCSIRRHPTPLSTRARKKIKCLKTNSKKRMIKKMLLKIWLCRRILRSYVRIWKVWHLRQIIKSCQKIKRRNLRERLPIYCHRMQMTCRFSSSHSLIRKIRSDTKWKSLQ